MALSVIRGASPKLPTFPAWALTALIAITFWVGVLALFRLTHFHYARVFSTYFFGLAGFTGLLRKYTHPLLARVLQGISIGCLLIFLDILFS